MTAPEALRTAGRPPSTVSAPQHATTERLGGPETPLSPADLFGDTVRRRGLTLDDLIASALAAETPAELHATVTAFLAADIPGWWAVDVGPLLRMTWPRWLIRRPGTVTMTRLLEALRRELEQTTT